MLNDSRLNRFAYVLYATNTSYATAALVTLHSLKNLTTRDDLDFILLHTGLPQYLLTSIQSIGAVPIKVNRIDHTDNMNQFFKDCLIKLKVFQLMHYERVVYLDVDSVLLKNLDGLFTLPFPESLAAPRAYWLQQPWASSMLMVVKPSLALWDRITPYIRIASQKRYLDMEIINYAFKDDICFLPQEMTILNSEWEDRNQSFRFGDSQQTLNSVCMIHFTGLGKPWYFHPKWIRHLRPEAYPIFYNLWQTWWSIREEIICQSPPVTRLKHILLKFWNLRKIITLFPQIK